MPAVSAPNYNALQNLLVSFPLGVDQEIAKIDYNTSDIFIHIPATNATSTDIQVEIALVDDDIDEASLELFVMMLMTDDPRVNLTNGQFAARGNIRDNDGRVIST